MCYPPEARPPDVPADLLRGDRALLPISGGSGGTDVVLTSEDGGRFRAYLARAQDGEAGVVIAPDVRGLHPFYEELAERLASAGVHAIAFDYFGRTAGVDRRPPDWAHQDHNAKNTTGQIHADLTTAIGHLRGATDARSIYVMGFCKGGRVAFNAAAEHSGISGAIGFYGWPARRSDEDPAAPVDNVDRMHVPVLGLFGGADKGIPASAVEQFEKALTGRAVRHHIHTYPGAPHSFFDRELAEFRSESEDSWRRVLGFIRTGDPTAKA
jgi:carboxymethylenebutenolidase